jgi:pentatricopeptide repeat protein
MGCQPNGVCYDGVISALSKHGRHREALYLYYEMTSNGLKATRKTYQRLVHAIDHSRDPELSRPRRIALLEGESYLTLLQGLSDTTNPFYSLLYSNQVSCAGCPSRIGASE